MRVGDIFNLGRKIGGGSFGEIYHGKNVETGEEVAIKLEYHEEEHRQLALEARAYSDLEEVVGLPRLHHYGTEGNLNVMVIDLLGSCLADLFDECGQRFSLKTVLMLADQLLRRLEAIHEKGYIHRDIKPDNIMMGRGSWQDIVYIVDFGLCKQHQLPIMLQPRPYHATGIFYGTSRYASINTHRRVEQSQRDDLESLGYMLMYLLRGSLPWQGTEASTKEHRYERVLEQKIALTKNYPAEFRAYFDYVQSLLYGECPDYSYLKRQFRELFYSKGYGYDYQFDWVLPQNPNANASAGTGGASGPEGSDASRVPADPGAGNEPHVDQKNKASTVSRQKRKRGNSSPRRPTDAQQQVGSAGKEQQRRQGYNTRSAAAKQAAGADTATATAQRGRRVVNSSA